ncbi:hypothetical protein GJV26_17390 [Massilia dura]|uniref:Aspartate kinase n=1 Tax=Pseudoduganella dura TaxID=321982 RepID=A0A6I3XCB2_9BURK|nr:hypothetical protein [Pseudoduganella dura]MUI14219.1 hypothetical protein [Pseudoduganella dura]GGX76424.1 hypothetical protein GCM10007386_04230 [Pseudoduganella dura]
MLSIATRVERIVMESPFLSEGLRRGLINLSELARQLQPQLESDSWKPVGQAAVVMALRRVSERLPVYGDEGVQEIVLARKTGQLTARTDLVELTWRESPGTDACHRELLAQHDRRGDMFLTVTRNVNEAMVICSRPLIPLVESVFDGECLLARLDNLNAVTLQLTADSHRTPGIYHAILKKLAWDRVNLVNLISTHSELTLILDRQHTGAAFAVLSALVAH